MPFNFYFYFYGSSILFFNLAGWVEIRLRESHFHAQERERNTLVSLIGCMSSATAGEELRRGGAGNDSYLNLEGDQEFELPFSSSLSWA